MRSRVLAALLTGLCVSFAQAQEQGEKIPLWPNGAPGFEDRKDEPEFFEDYYANNIHNPNIEVYLPDPEKATGAGVLICPGGGHRLLTVSPEGAEPAKFLNEHGVAAFVLRYRLAREENSPYELGKEARQDAQRALRLIRSRADDWHVDPERLGILGFSAGGETAMWAAFGETTPAGSGDEIDQLHGRPDFLALVYPGPLGIPDTVPEDAPPLFLTVTADDGAERGVARLFEGYREAKRPLELHYYNRGGHAFSMGTRTPLVSLQHWPERLTDWMADNYILDANQRAEEEQRERQRRERRRNRQQQRQNAE